MTPSTGASSILPPSCVSYGGKGNAEKTFPRRGPTSRQPQPQKCCLTQSETPPAGASERTRGRKVGREPNQQFVAARAAAGQEVWPGNNHRTVRTLIATGSDFPTGYCVHADNVAGDGSGAFSGRAEQITSSLAFLTARCPRVVRSRIYLLDMLASQRIRGKSTCSAAARSLTSTQRMRAPG